MRQVLVVGVGSIGERHARCFLQTGRAQVGFVEPQPQLRQAVHERYDIARHYASLDEALAAGTWDTAIICTPAHTHVPLSLACLDRKIPILIEKPLAITTADASRLFAPAAGVPVGVAYVYRAHPAVTAIRQAAAAGQFGRPLQVICVSGQNFPTYRPAYASTYYTRHETGGGAIQDALTHTLNAAQWIVGPITRLCADASHCVLPGTQVEDTVNLIARHGGVMASYAMNQHQAPNENTLTVICERGVARCEIHHQQWMWQVDPTGQWHVEKTPLESRDSWFINQCNAWLDVLDGKAAPLCTLAEAWQTLAANEAALKSCQANIGWVDVPGLSPDMEKH